MSPSDERLRELWTDFFGPSTLDGDAVAALRAIATEAYRAGLEAVEPALRAADGYLTQGDCLHVLAEIERGIENVENAGPSSNMRDGTILRKGKLHAYRYAKSRLVSMMKWKGMKW